ncbi:MAG: hypothetical protein EA380_04510 [Phycisphaeraceae bacterium]|nr:MAG: hypothetical protein EA380_04510 [Phycisphaeraceae bacterium]
MTSQGRTDRSESGPAIRLANEEFDALTDLFLGDTGPGRPDEPAPRPRLVQDHAEPEDVPVRHAPMPSTERAASKPSPAQRPPTVEAVITGHLPVRSGLWVSQYSARSSEERAEPVALVRMVAGSATVDLYGVPRPEAEDASIEARTLEDALRHARRYAGVCIVHTDETQSPRLLDDARIGTITILTGANDAAVVDAYRAIKGISQRAEGRGTPPTIRLAIMGADRKRADEAGAKIREAVSVFLSAELDIAPPISAMGATGAWSLCRATTELDVPTILDAWFSTEDAEESETVTATGTVAELEHETHDTPCSEAIATSLAGHIAGLRPLHLPWPGPAGVEFALDEANRLHALASEAIGGLAGLTSAHGWAQRHAELIRMALSANGAIPNAGSPILHLFTGTAREIRPLLDTEVKIHLLARIDPGTDYFTTELN